ncbi:MAG TPA: MBL fold metallo-hydrolase [Solirubrobacteraceae bacterium]|jgi:glyoxylase-like metal-dependent hydrolase (beta-lactamase superfamily II)|nr:MBL fold metallo-hydrolase [Solirubrobacteraceae bacterium]
MIDVRAFTVGPIQENCYFVRRPDATSAVIVDPGEEAPRLLEALEALNISSVEAILLTHCHFDHVGAVKPIHDATGAPVWCPELETDRLANINEYTFPGFGPFEGCSADHTVAGGETLALAGLTVDVRFTPGHSPGHVTYSVRGEDTLLSGDVLFEGSIGRTDLPGGDMATLLASIESLLDEFPAQARVCPGHGAVTTLGNEQASNPFLRQLAHHS